jgi:hypothetical protein
VSVDQVNAAVSAAAAELDALREYAGVARLVETQLPQVSRGAGGAE